jgi:predicted TIM-barrel fold metal-dependent hydrolase
MPGGACDCHVHVFEPDRFPLSSRRTYKPATATIGDLKRFLDRLRLSRVVLVQPSPYHADNRLLIEALGVLGNRARGVAVIDGTMSHADLAALHQAGIRGARVNLESFSEADTGAVAKTLQETAARVADFGWHVQIHARLGLLSAVEATLRSLPTQLVVDHFGYAATALEPDQPHLDALLRLLGEGKAYVKLSAAHRIGPADEGAAAKPVARRLIDANPDHIVWGSDWPHTGVWPNLPRHPDRIEPFHPIDDGLALKRLAHWMADSAELERVLVTNPARLYDF